MSCIIRNNNGKVQEVTVDGKPSQLFAQIEAVPFMKDREQSADYYAYVKNRKNLELNDQKEPILVFKPIDSDLVFEDSYAAANQKDVNNSGVSVGVLKTTDNKQEIISTALPTDILDAEFEVQFEETTQDILIANYPDGSKRYGVKKAAKYNEIDSFKTNYTPNSIAGFISRLQNSGINLSNRETVNQVLEFPNTQKASDVTYIRRDLGEGESQIMKVQDGKKKIINRNAVPQGAEIIDESDYSPTPQEDISDETNIMESNGAKIYFRQRKNPITGANENMVELELIEVPEDQRGQGAARLAMTNFLEYTDNLGTDVYLIASPRDKQTDLNQLIGFYRSLGFESTPFFNEEMIRKTPNKKSYINQNINEDLLINSLIQDGTIEANCRL